MTTKLIVTHGDGEKNHGRSNNNDLAPRLSLSRYYIREADLAQGTTLLAVSMATTTLRQLAELADREWEERWGRIPNPVVVVVLCMSSAGSSSPPETCTAGEKKNLVRAD